MKTDSGSQPAILRDSPQIISIIVAVIRATVFCFEDRAWFLEERDETRRHGGNLTFETTPRFDFPHPIPRNEE